MLVLWPKTDSPGGGVGWQTQAKMYTDLTRESPPGSEAEPRHADVGRASAEVVGV